LGLAMGRAVRRDVHRALAAGRENLMEYRSAGALDLEISLSAREVLCRDAGSL